METLKKLKKIMKKLEWISLVGFEPDTKGYIKVNVTLNHLCKY